MCDINCCLKYIHSIGLNRVVHKSWWSLFNGSRWLMAVGDTNKSIWSATYRGAFNLYFRLVLQIVIPNFLLHNAAKMWHRQIHASMEKRTLKQFLARDPGQSFNCNDNQAHAFHSSYCLHGASNDNTSVFPTQYFRASAYSI